MNFHESFSRHTYFRDCITFNNFIAFVFVREYIDNAPSLPCGSEEEKYNFYMFLLKLLRGGESATVGGLSEPSCISESLLSIFAERMQSLRNLGELVEYVHPNYVKSALHHDALEMEDSGAMTFHSRSLVGQFLRKFSIGFQLLTFEQTVAFSDAFFSFYDSSIRSEITKLSDLSQCAALMTSSDGHLSANQVINFSEEVCKKAGQIGTLSRQECQKLIETLQNFAEVYPDMAAPHFASHSLALRLRNFTTAETELYKAFEMQIAGKSHNSSTKDLKPADAWTQMALASAAMHHYFGHERQAQSFLEQALRQALETNNTASLRQVRAAHEVICSFGEPFRYGALDVEKRTTGPTELLLTELRTKMLKQLADGAPPSSILLSFFNSEVAAKVEAMAVVLLDLALIVAYHGYRSFATCLLQCVIITDCLRPCPISDQVLSTALAQLARAYATSGKPAEAVELMNRADEILGRFVEKGSFTRACLETQLEQALRIHTDLSDCDRLVKSLSLFCPWEATLRRAEVELRRGNTSTAKLLLQKVAAVATDIRTSLDFNRFKLAESNQEESGDAFLHHVRDPHLSRPPNGGLGAVVRFEVRARLAMVDIFISAGLLLQANQQLNLTEALTSKYHLIYFGHVVTLLKYVVGVLSKLQTSCELSLPLYLLLPLNRKAEEGEVQLPDDVFHALQVVCHQADPGFCMRLLNLIAWIFCLGGNREVLGQWEKHLRMSAAFFANLGDRQALLNTCVLFEIVRAELHSSSDLKTDSSSQHLPLFPLSI
uniref:Anaphase-promoting complex subunit 5 n=1 Tax=Schistocephalus solidus TaxID=70667 RepID=A0A0X3PWJ2_SCHSO